MAIVACAAVGALVGVQFWGGLGALIVGLTAGVLAYCSADGCTAAEKPQERPWTRGYVRK